MKNDRSAAWFVSLVALIFLSSMATVVNAQERPIFSREDVERARNAASQGTAPGPVLGCTGPITRVIDLADESVRATSANFLANPGGGEGGGFDKTPILSTKVGLAQGTCLNAHLSAIVGKGRATQTMFQVTLTFLPPTTLPFNPPRHMVGHLERPFGISSPAVFLEPESQADMFAANFFQKVGTGSHEVRPGTYRVDVWWSGAGGPGGALGAAFVLKLYLR